MAASTSRLARRRAAPAPVAPGGIPETRRDIDGTLPAWYNKPGQLRQEYLVSAAMRIASVPGQVLRDRVRPQVPQYLNPPRTGYGTEALTVGDILLTDRFYPTRRAWVSGAGIMLQRSQLQEDQWSGGARNSMVSPNAFG